MSARSGAIALMLLSGAGAGICPAGVSDYAVELQSPRDQAAFAWEGGKLSVQITSAIGIGRVQVVAKDQAAWPDVVVLALRTGDGKPLKELEGFTLSGETLRIEGSRRTSGRMACHEIDPKNPKVRKNARQVNVVVTRTKSAMEVTIPGKLLVGQRKLRIQWIDFYR